MSVKSWKIKFQSIWWSNLLLEISLYFLVLALLQCLKLLPSSAAAIAANPAADIISAAETWDCCWDSVEALDEAWFWWDWWAEMCSNIWLFIFFDLVRNYR